VNLNAANLTDDQKAAIEEGQALAKETPLPVLLVAVANATANTKNGATDMEAAKLVALASLLFMRLTTPIKGAVARRTKH